MKRGGGKSPVSVGPNPALSSHYTIVFPATAGSTQSTVGITEYGAEGDILLTTSPGY